MATLDELFAEVGLTPPQRTNRNRTVTTPGSYEAPVEGIQDYGAFQRGFTAGVTPGLIEKKKQDIRVDDAAKEFDALKLTELIETSDTDPIAFKKNAALRGQTLSLLKGNLRADYLKAAKFNDTESKNNILSQISNLSEGITNLNTFLAESQKTDQYDIEASNYKIGDATYTDSEGNKQALTFNQLADVNNNNPEALSYVQRKDKYGAVDTFLTVKGSKYGSFEVNISDLNAAQIQNRLALKADYGTETSDYIKDNPLIKQNPTVESKTEDKNGVRTTTTTKEITDAVDVENRNNAAAYANKIINNAEIFEELRPSYLVQALKRKDIGNTQAIKGALAALKSEQGMQKYADANNLTLDNAKNDVKNNVDEIIRKALQNEYLKRTGSYEWDKEEGEYVKAVLDKKTSTSPISAGKDSNFNIMFGGQSIDDDLLKRTKELLAITAVETNEQGQILSSSRNNVINYITGQELNFETNKKGTQEKISGEVIVTSDMISIKPKKITTGSDAGQTKAIIIIQPKPLQLEEGGETVEFEPIEYDLTQSGGVEKLLANQYGFSTDKGKKFKAQYDPVLNYLKALRKGTINEDGTTISNPLLK
ncbi:hypothetical protein [Marinobacter sp.]|uniref:hypothetical protein n=1 Tax=Marinobacter sp. TaxID=50741 RepID=UPI000C9313C1|nr:hypothetical protein [Marinobacter sp.]MAB53494.1 hypothetical protein [Marinobacter sp.]